MKVESGQFPVDIKYFGQTSTGPIERVFYIKPAGVDDDRISALSEFRARVQDGEDSNQVVQDLNGQLNGKWVDVYRQAAMICNSCYLHSRRFQRIGSRDDREFEARCGGIKETKISIAPRDRQPVTHAQLDIGMRGSDKKQLIDDRQTPCGISSPITLFQQQGKV